MHCTHLLSKLKVSGGSQTNAMIPVEVVVIIHVSFYAIQVDVHILKLDLSDEVCFCVCGC